MTRAVARIDPKETAGQVMVLLDNRADQLRALLGNDERLYERFRTVALHAVTSNPKVLESDPASIIEAIRDSATLGLEPNGLMGEGYVLPYRNRNTGRYEAQFQVGWRGLLKLIRRSGEIASIDAQCVYEEDEFALDLGSEPRVVHRPSLTARGNRVGAYAICRLRSGELVIEWMPNAEIEMVRRSSRAADDGPWVDWPDEMARKTVLKRIAKRLPLAHVAERALEIEARAEEESARPQRIPATAHNGDTPMARVHERLGLNTSGPAPFVPRADGTAVDGLPPVDQEQEEVRDDAAPTVEEPPPPAEHAAGPVAAGSGRVNPMAAPTCPAFSGEFGRCQRTLDHRGPHRNKADETWA
jgi:recombination protein RecT